MKLYLSSQGFGNHLERLHEMVGTDKRVLFIDNAKDYYTPEERAAHVAEKKSECEAVDFTFEELDLREYFESQVGLKAKLEGANFLFVSGGNTFILRRAFSYSGLDGLLTKIMNVRADFVYGGSSAGSILATRTLHGTELGDEPHVVPGGYGSDIVWDGLGFTETQIVPHYGSDRWHEKAEAMKRYFQTHDMPYQTLRDGEVYVVDDGFEGKLA